MRNENVESVEYVGGWRLTATWYYMCAGKLFVFLFLASRHFLCAPIAVCLFAMAEIFWKKSYFEIGSRFGGNALCVAPHVRVTFPSPTLKYQSNRRTYIRPADRTASLPAADHGTGNGR